MSKESEYIHKRHNVSVMIYHFVCPAKYRRVIFDEEVDNNLKEICQEIEKRYDIRFLEIGTDKNHVHFLIQSVPKVSATQIIRTIKSITAKEIFVRCPYVKKRLWGGEFWSDGYFVNTVGQHGNEETISRYVKNQGIEKEYKSMLKQPLQLSFFDVE
jgi:REP element-mobilizing transposase RayT